jgi:hypothetical protein
MITGFQTSASSRLLMRITLSELERADGENGRARHFTQSRFRRKAADESALSRRCNERSPEWSAMLGVVNKYPTHVIERWEYDLARDLIAALLADDRAAFDERLTASDGDRLAVHADLLGVALTVAEFNRWRFPFVHVRPSAEARDNVVETLASSQFADLIDLDLARLVLNRLYQRAFIDPVIASPDLTSMTTCLAVCAWTLWNRWAALPRDRWVRWHRPYRATTVGLRFRRLRTFEWIRTDPPAHAADTGEDIEAR